MSSKKSSSRSPTAKQELQDEASSLVASMLKKKSESSKSKNYETYYELMLTNPKLDVWKLCKSGNLEYLMSYIRVENGEGRESVVARQDKDGSTGLHYASKEGHLNCVKYLLSCNADRDTADCRGWTALHYAAAGGHLEILLALIEPPETKRSLPDCLGFTPLHEATRFRRVDCVKALVTPGPSWPGAEVDATSNLGTTPLHLAAHLGYLEIVQILVENNATIVTRNMRLLSAIEMTSNPEIREFLIKAKKSAKKIKRSQKKGFFW